MEQAIAERRGLWRDVKPEQLPNGSVGDNLICCDRDCENAAKCGENAFFKFCVTQRGNIDKLHRQDKWKVVIIDIADIIGLINWLISSDD